MTPTELIAEARELDRMATPGPWEAGHYGAVCLTNGFKLCNAEGAGNAAYIARSRTLLPALCDALEAAQSTLEQTWEWDMYQAAKREIERLRNTNKALENDNYNAEMNLAHLTAELEAAQNAQRWISVEERLPDAKAHYLVITKLNWANGGSGESNGGDMRRNMAIAYHDITGRWNVPHVTHWQPLPAAPKGENNA